MAEDPLWAPWRLSYVKGEKEPPEPEDRLLELLPEADPSCFFCRAVVDSNRRRRHVVDRGEHSITILNRYPYNNGHLLIGPQKHLGRLDELPSNVQVELTRTIARMVGVLEKILQPDGFNVGLNLGRVAGAGLPGHLHWHVVPRWTGDTNFMPAVSATNVIPQSLESLWELLTEELRVG